MSIASDLETLIHNINRVVSMIEAQRVEVLALRAVVETALSARSQEAAFVDAFRLHFNRLDALANASAMSDAEIAALKMAYLRVLPLTWLPDVAGTNAGGSVDERPHDAFGINGRRPP